MQTRLQLLLLLIVLTVSGCATWHTTKTVLHPIQETDIAVMKKDVPYTPKKDGYFLSELYLKEVVQAKVEQKSK